MHPLLSSDQALGYAGEIQEETSKVNHTKEDLHTFSYRITELTQKTAVVDSMAGEYSS